MTTEEREILDLKFSGVNAKIDSEMTILHETLKRIEEQTTKTNDRVNKHDDRLRVVENFRWYVLGGIAVFAFLFSYMILLLKVEKKINDENKTTVEITTRGEEYHRGDIVLNK